VKRVNGVKAKFGRGHSCLLVLDQAEREKSKPRKSLKFVPGTAENPSQTQNANLARLFFLLSRPKKEFDHVLAHIW